MKMKNNYQSFIICLFSIASLCLFSCSEEKIDDTSTFIRTFGESRNDAFRAGLQTSDGGYIMCGYTWTDATFVLDMYLVKTDNAGNRLWSKTYGTSKSEIAFSLVETEDQGYVLCGARGDRGVETTILIKTDYQGNPEWLKTFDTPSYCSLERYCSSIQRTSDSGFIICGSMDNDAYLIKTDSEGNELWHQSFGINYQYEFGRSIKQTTDGGFIVLVFSTDDDGIYTYTNVIKTDGLGNEEWSQSYSGSEPYCINQTKDGDYLFCGGDEYNSQPSFLISIDHSGNQKWHKEYYLGEGRSFILLDDGGIVITGCLTESEYQSYDIFLLRTGGQGNELWIKTFGGLTDDFGYDLQCTSDEGYMICGSTWSLGSGGLEDALLIITDPNGDIE
ncbi:hypothetical protein ACFL27_17065 [candidate division CSSED10-310 bacterium]|uniref:Bulb-type lectin domain-containing protein n=1 Tax=candidate division CSSED10-310 bacterium TaxID=2855610 RepID=A0ABV6Z0D6_UNCC1